MSHLTRIKTRLVEREYLLKALKELGYTPEMASSTTESLFVHGLAGERARAEIKVKISRLGREVGFRKSGDGTYEIVVDWWGSGLGLREDFLQKVTQRYAYHAALAKLEEQGFTLSSEEIQQNGQIHLTLRRVA